MPGQHTAMTNSPRTPAGIANSRTGADAAVCTSATTNAGLPSSTRSHCAPTVCIQLPMPLTRLAIQSIRKTPTLKGARGVGAAKTD